MATGEMTLLLDRRAVTGKKVQALRRAGVVPANIYGRGLASVSVQAPVAEFRRVLRAVDRNAVISVQVDGEPTPRPVVLRQVRHHPVSGQVLHIDLYQVDLSRAIHSEATVVLVGDSEAVHNGGVLVENLSHVTLEALPNEMPSEVTVDISVLRDFGHSILVSDLVLPAGVSILNDPTAAVVAVIAPRIAEEAAEEAAEALAQPAAVSGKDEEAAED